MTPVDISLQPCGTPAAHARHIRRGEKPCELCLRAAARKAQRYRDRDRFRDRSRAKRPKPDVSWMAAAQCAEVDTAVFFAHDTARAKAICATCPARDACLDFALLSGEQDGVWGGMDEQERAREKERRRKAVRRAREMARRKAS